MFDPGTDDFNYFPIAVFITSHFIIDVRTSQIPSMVGHGTQNDDDPFVSIANISDVDLGAD